MADSGDGPRGTEDESATSSPGSSGDTGGSGGADTGIPEGCQNGTLDPGEECDDGNNVNADGCNRDCRISAMLQWSVTHAAGVGQVDDGFGVVASGDGSTVVSGYVSDAAEARDGFIRRYDETGTAMWTDGLAGTGGGNDEIRGLVEDDAGNVYAAGYESGPVGEGLNAWLRKYDPAGAALWTRTYNGPNNSTDVFDGVTIDGDGNIVAAGYHNVLDEGADVFLRKYDPDGNVLWTRSSSGENGGTDLIWKVAVSEAGHIYVAGYENGPAGEGYNAWLAKYDGDGNLIWDRSYNGDASLDDYLIGVEVVGDDDVLVCGYQAEAAYPWHVTVRRYDSLGMLAWSDDYAGESGEGAHCFGIAVDGDGNIVTTGGEIVAGIRGVLVRKYEPDGTVLWNRVIPGGAMGPDYGREVDIGAGEEIFITGAVDTGIDVRDLWLGVLTP
jgi:cysteine-rich repeat protein